MLNLKRIGLITAVIVSLASIVQAEEPQGAAPTASPVTPEPSVAAPSPAASEELNAALQERVERYWAARQARDVRTLYDLESAARPGGWLKLEQAMSLQGLPVRKVKVEEVRVEGEKAITRISAEVMIGTMGWMRQTIEDPWVLLDGQWYHETFRN